MQPPRSKLEIPGGPKWRAGMQDKMDALQEANTQFSQMLGRFVQVIRHMNGNIVEIYGRLDRLERK